MIELPALPAGMTPRDYIRLGGPCIKHTWQLIGGRNACCGSDCVCSVPVHVCSCGDCDYGDNAEADRVRVACAEMGPA
jgi:predicted metal-binding transcription factor (methanogenesis marker protein 9)